jgi:hypothetical protein
MKQVAITGSALVADTKAASELAILTNSTAPQTRPGSYYKGREVKTLVKLFMEQGHTKEYSRRLAKIWLGMTEAQRQNVMAGGPK